MNRILLAFSAVFVGFIAFSQGGVNCPGMAPICTDVGLNFTANADGDEASTLDPGNNYDCLIGQPNPTWYYFQIATDGNIEMELAATFDIDFAIWGPFSSLSVAQAACGSLGNQTPPDPNNGNLVDCSFSIAAVENPVITGALTGEVYVMLITNYAGMVQDIALTQTGGTGSTDCDIVINPPCSISALNTTVSGCDFITNNYSVTGTIETTNPPTSGDLVVEDCDGNTSVIASAPFNATSFPFTISNLSANGSACTLQAYFTSETACSQTVNYVSPACINNCPAYENQASSPTEACGNQQYFLEVQNSACDGIVNFEIIGDYGSFPSEISWFVLSNLTGNQVASGTGGTAGGIFSVSVGPLDPNTEGTVFNLVVQDAWGDGFSGGGYIQVESMDGSTVFAGPIEGNFGTEANQYFNSGIIVSSSTISVTTPSGTVTSNIANCADHSVPITLENNNYCTPTVVDLPWSITCDLTGDLIASGTHTVTVYPQVPTSASDLVSIDWNSTTCSWEVTPQNDCGVLDLGVLYSISPDPMSLGPSCADGTEEFTVTYLGFTNGPDCCSTGGPLTPATYTNSQGTSDFITQTAYGGTNNAAYGTISPSGIGGNSTSLTIDVSGSGYCFPNVPADPFAPTDPNADSYYVDVYVDGVQIAIYGPLNDPPGSFNYSFSHADLIAAGVTYNQNSIIEVYVLPNQFAYLGPPIINTTYVPGADCNTLAAGEWSASNFSIDVNATYEQLVPSPANCTFVVSEPYTCCVTNSITALPPANENVECLLDVPAADINSVTNIVSNCPTVVAFVSDVSDGNTCPEIITRTYSVSDDCGNVTNLTQTITINDSTPPTATGPMALTVECVDDVPVADISVVTAADNCTANPTVSFVSEAYTAVDGYIVNDDLSWISSTSNLFQSPDYDFCNSPVNYSISTQTSSSSIIPGTTTLLIPSDINTDNSPQVDININFNQPVQNLSIYVKDLDQNVDPTNGNNLEESLSDLTVNGMPIVPFIIPVTGIIQWDAINQIISSVGNNASGWIVLPVAVESFSFTYNRPGILYGLQIDSIQFDCMQPNPFLPECTEFVTRTYSVTDNCGNETLVIQPITISNITPPTASNPAGVTVECIDDVPAADVSVVTDAVDNCTAIPTVAFVEDVSDGNTCPEIITRTYSVTDDCGNVANLTQTITVNDSTPPTASNPAGLIFECIGDVPTPDISVVNDAADNCTAVPTVSFVEDVSDGNTCPEIITRTYSVTDDCGNSINVTQTITINDITPPTASNPANINIPLAPVPAPDITVVTDAADNCTLSPIVAFVEDQSDGGDCPEVITRTYSVTDDCGNETLVNQLIIIGGGLVPSPTVAANGPICEGEDAVFTIDGLADAVVTYDIGAGPETVTLLGGTGDVTVSSVNSDVTITLSNISDGSCSSMIEISETIVVTPLSFPTFTGFGPYCLNETPDMLPILSVEGYSGTWNPPNIDTSTSGIGIYTFTPDPGQCAQSATLDISIQPLIAPSFIQIEPLCLNALDPGLPTLSQDGISGIWSPSAINTSAIGGSTYTFTPDAGQCAAVFNMDIEIIPLPEVSLTDQLINCITNTSGAQIGMAGVVGNTYSWSPLVGITNPSISDPIATPSTTTLYTLTVTGVNGCTADGTVNVTVDDVPPNVGITNNTGTTTLSCTQLEISITATGADIYSWDNGLGNISSPTITSPGIYTVTGTGPNGCQSNAQIEIIQDNGVDLMLVLGQSEICSGETVEISMNSATATDFNWTVIQNGVTGASDGSVINTVSGATVSQELTLDGSVNGTVDYVVEPLLSGCVGLAQTVTVTVLSPETPQFSQLGPFCLNDVAGVLPSTSMEGILGSWAPPTITTNTAGLSTYNFSPNPGQCAVSQNMDIVVNDLPIVSFSGDSLLGCAPHSVVLSSPNDVCTWTISNGIILEGNQVTLNLTNPGCYDVTLEVDENGCTNSLTMPNYLCVQEDPIANFTVSPDVFTDNDVLVSFTNLSSGASSFLWDFGDGNTSSYINPTNLYETTDEGALITLTAISEFGCTDQVQLIIEYDEQEIFYIPNTFTPDGDNFNQMFTPVFYSGFDPYNFEMLIFNRWGEIVFETQNSETGWDGTYGVNGTKAMDGTYSWKITYKNPKTDQRKVISGHVTLLR